MIPVFRQTAYGLVASVVIATVLMAESRPSEKAAARDWFDRHFAGEVSALPFKFADSTVFYVRSKSEKFGPLAQKPGSLAFAILPLLKKQGCEWMLNREAGRVLANGRRRRKARPAAPSRFVFP